MYSKIIVIIKFVMKYPYLNVLLYYYETLTIFSLICYLKINTIASVTILLV